MTIGKINLSIHDGYGSALYAILDLKLDGYITWSEKKKGIGEIIGVLMFSKGDLAEEYIHKVMPARAEFVSVCKVGKKVAHTFVAQMVSAGVDYALIDIPPIAVDQLAEGEVAAQQDLDRDYMIVDMKKLAVRFMS